MAFKLDFYKDFDKIACFGIAGNFTGHLEQAGEAADFTKIKTLEKNAPKGMFPTYLPKINDKGKCTPSYLNVFPFDSKKIIFPENEDKIQIEPECAVIFNAEWNNKKLVNLKPLVFGASNDCSIRKQGAKKISEKKNWGVASKGLSENLIETDGFSAESKINDYRIASFLVRNGIVHEYGENSAVKNYSYVYEKLVSWLLQQINNQKDEDPLENIYEYLIEAGMPEYLMVSIGATRYTFWGKANFLQNGDRAVVIVYPETKYSTQDILLAVQNNAFSGKDISVLNQIITLGE